MAISTRTDEEIQANVLEELKWDSRVRPNEIGVAVKDGIVTLTDWVDSYLKKMAAEEAAHRVPGVKAVANDIEVRLPGFAERTDTDLAAAVLNALRWDAAIPTGKVDVTVSQGWVTLKGEVEYAFQKRDAERAVRRLSGWSSPRCSQQTSSSRSSERSSVMRRPMPGISRSKWRAARSSCVERCGLTRRNRLRRIPPGQRRGSPRLRTGLWSRPCCNACCMASQLMP